MAKNLKIIDLKPSNSKVLDSKTSNKVVIEEKSKNQGILTDFGTEQFYTVILGKGMATGMVGMTYPEAITISSSYSP